MLVTVTTSSDWRSRALWLLLPGLAAAAPAAADPGYYLLTPYSVPGQLAVDLRYWTVKAPGRPVVLWPEVGLRYGVNTRWTTELLASYIGTQLRHLDLGSLSWQNTYLLTQGQYPFDLALHAQLIRNRGQGNALAWGPVFQTDIGATQVNLNLVFEREWGLANGSPSQGTQLKYQWQLLQRLRPGLRLGVQGFGEMGRWNHPSDPASHRAGPALNWRLPGQVDLRAAYLWGKTYGGRGDMFSAQLLWPF